MQTKSVDGQMSLFGPDTPYGRMSSEHIAAPIQKILGSSSGNSFKLKNHPLMLLDLRPGAGNMLGPCWEYDPVWLGRPGTLNTSECPKDVVESSLSQILLDTVPSKYYLSPTACLGILRRAAERGKALPPLLEFALRAQSGLTTYPTGSSDEFPACRAYHINQRDEGIDLGDKAGTLMATSNMQMQTFVTAGFLPESSVTARNIGYQEECAPTLKAGGKSSAIFRRRRVDAFHEDTSVSTQSARQGKDATDLILTERVSNTPYPLLIRRLVPLECERLQGFPDGWTDLPGAPDSARFKALGNSVAIPCVEHLMLCISLALQDPIHRYQI